MPSTIPGLDRIGIDRTHIVGSIDPVNPVYTYEVEQIHAVDGIADGDSQQPRSALVGRCAAALGLLALLAACDMSERAEALYLQQHRATTALTETIVVAETEDPSLAERLYVSESELDEACAPLREAGYRKLYGEEVDSALEWAIVESLDACAAKAQEVELLLWRVDPETANYFLGGADMASAGTQN